MSIQPVAEDPHHFAHGEGRSYGADAKTLQMTEKEEGHAAGDRQADDVKGNFDLRVGNAGDLGQLPGKEIRGNDGQAAPVGQGDAEADVTVSYFTAALRPAFFSSRFMRQTASVRTSRMSTSASRT